MSSGLVAVIIIVAASTWGFIWGSVSTARQSRQVRRVAGEYGIAFGILWAHAYDAEPSVMEIPARMRDDAARIAEAAGRQLHVAPHDCPGQDACACARSFPGERWLDVTIGPEPAKRRRKLRIDPEHGATLPPETPG